LAVTDNVLCLLGRLSHFSVTLLIIRVTRENAGVMQCMVVFRQGENK